MGKWLNSVAITMLIVTTILFGCTQTDESVNVAPDNSSETESPDSEEDGDINELAEPAELPYAYILSPGFERENGIACPELREFHFLSSIAFDFAEIAWDVYPIGKCSVDELEEKYGEANEIRGSIDRDKYIIVSGIWDNVYIRLETIRSGKMSFDIVSNKDPGFHSLSTEDRAIEMPVTEINIYGEEMPLPRGIKIGQSTIDDVRAAYPHDTYDDTTNFIDQYYVFFDEIATKQDIEFSDVGSLTYRFSTNGILYEVIIRLPSEL